MFACEPEWGWTLACSAPNSSLARAMASDSTIVDILATAVIALARIAFGVFVGHHAALRLQHRLADDVFRGDQFQIILQAPGFLLNRGENFRVRLFEK